MSIFLKDIFINLLLFSNINVRNRIKGININLFYFIFQVKLAVVSQKFVEN